MFLLLSFVCLQISLTDFYSQCKMKVLFFGPASAGMFSGQGQAGIWKGCRSGHFRALSTFSSALVLICQCLSRSHVCLLSLLLAEELCRIREGTLLWAFVFPAKSFHDSLLFKTLWYFPLNPGYKESVSFWILSLLTYLSPSSNPFSPWAPGFPIEPCVHHMVPNLSPASLPLALASFVAQEPLVPSPVLASDDQRLYSHTLGFEVWFFLPAASSSSAFRLSEPSFALLWNGFLAVLARWIKWSNVEVDMEASGTSW